MANTGRSTYEPPDDIHVFDGAEDDDDVEGSRLPLLIVIALFVLAAFAGVVWLAYHAGRGARPLRCAAHHRRRSPDRQRSRPAKPAATPPLVQGPEDLSAAGAVR